MTWEHFRRMFEAEHMAGLRPDTRHNYKMTLDAFERLCRPTQMRCVTEPRRPLSPRPPACA